MLLYDWNIIALSRESLVIFGKCLKNVWKSSSFLQNHFGKSSEIFRKSSKMSSLVCLYKYKQNITCPLVDMNFIFSCSTRHLTSECSEWARFWVEHSKINFVSTCSQVISATYHFLGRFSFFAPGIELILGRLTCFDIKSIVSYLFLLICTSFSRNNVGKKTQFCRLHLYKRIFWRWISTWRELKWLLLAALTARFFK